VVKGYLSSADAVWLTANIRRAVNDKTTKEHLSDGMKRALVARGFRGQLSFIATQADALTRSEARARARCARPLTSRARSASRAPAMRPPAERPAGPVCAQIVDNLNLPPETTLEGAALARNEYTKARPSPRANVCVCARACCW
jgi:hypothetical protein